MKLLTSDQQVELQQLITNLVDSPEYDNAFGAEVRADLTYWAIELRPKRVRKKNEEKILTGMEEAVQYAVDNPVS